MATSVQVLAPNGRRQTVKVNSNHSVLQIIEEVCAKQGFPPEQYDIKHQRTVLDVNIPIRFANLPNNAKLELVKATKPRKECEVDIALQLESNERLQHSFLPSTTLWEILEHWESQQDGAEARFTKCSDETSVPPLHPVCIYMRREIIGEKALRATSLKALGLTSGRAIIRFLHRATELPLEVTSPPRKTARQISSETKTTVATTSTVQEVTTKEECPPQHTHDEPMEAESSVPCKPADCGSTSAASRPVCEPMQSGATAEIELTPEQEQQAMIMGSALAASIFQHRVDEEMHRERQQELRKQKAQEIKLRQRYKELQSLSPTESFQNFKFPEETKGQNLYSNKYSELLKQTEPCERERLVFNPESEDRSLPTGEDVPDEFFEVTVNDVKKMYSDLQHERLKLEEQPLMTRTLKETQAIKLMEKYPKVAIRVHFPDRLVLQGLFRPQEPVKSVMEFVKDNLDDKDMKFYLYTTPPKYVLTKENQSLLEAKLVPAANVYFGCETPKECYLLRSLLGDVTTPTQADVSVSFLSAGKTMTPEGSSSIPHNAATAGTSSSSGATTSTDKIPKWLKLPGTKK
ncbi:tether containing UBX domain for GLUT4-like [Saccoglossus kowalevskii]|uniref:Tether containing UBX domain for GLUT4-like n=1 Tax=Saccoglossus kowalevskii TaxID=10224 RepID=A0ABM0M432_SACKO|nr:PREDICTED: tether containing UBX domain for GLUT4-like [Saccoglossus kowalevskii]